MRKRLATLLLAPLPALAECPQPPEAVLTLDYGSRYVAGDESRSEIDTDSQAELEAALGPIDDFIRALADASDDLEAAEDRAALAACTMEAMSVWARAGALRNLESRTARLTIGGRLSGLAMAARQAAPYAPEETTAEVAAWLADLAEAQMVFWEAEAPRGAAQGNLRAWAALGVAATADLVDDPIMRGWAAWSVAYVACTATEEGALPQEMSRGRLALHYQLHAAAPLTVAAAVLEAAGTDLTARCGGALGRIARFTVAESQLSIRIPEITGEVQNYFDGSREMRPFQLAWVEAWLALHEDAALEALIAPMRPLSHSKLGGDQTALWRLLPEEGGGT